MDTPFICSMCLRCIHYDNDECQDPVTCDTEILTCECCPIDCSAFEGEYTIHIHDDDVPF